MFSETRGMAQSLFEDTKAMPASSRTKNEVSKSLEVADRPYRDQEQPNQQGNNTR